VGFALSQLGFEVARRFRLLMDELSLDPRQFAVLRVIGLAAGQAQNEVAELLHVPPSSMVAAIDQFEQRGLVERRPHPSDRRARTLYLTAEGRDMLGRATTLAMGLESKLCEGLSAEGRADLLAKLLLVASNLGLPTGVLPGHDVEPGVVPDWPIDTGSTD
jgi:DNA-binding MarR family transcriptional regulator